MLVFSLERVQVPDAVPSLYSACEEITASVQEGVIAKVRVQLYVQLRYHQHYASRCVRH